MQAIVLGLLCAIFMVLRWKKMGSLLWLDPAHWLNEISRLARGEMPYRDYSFQYPPFVVLLYGWLLRVFGTSFTTVQVITDILDLLVVLVSILLIRRLLPRSLQLPVAACLIAVCATSLMNFNLFSYVTYSPSLQTGAFGTMLLLLVLLSYVREGRLSASGWILAALAGFISVYTKPESALATFTAIGLIALIDRKLWFAAKLGVVTVAPAAIAYVALGREVGFANMLAGISGYGLATAFCPWWPTGLGILGVTAALGEATAIAGICSLPRYSQFKAKYSSRYSALLWAGAAGIVVDGIYVVTQNVPALTASGLTLPDRAVLVLPSLIYTRAVLVPVLWVSIVAFLALAWRVLIRRSGKSGDAELLLIVALPVAMAGRALFSSTQGVIPDVAAICYPFFLILGPYFLWRFLASAASPRYATAVVATIVIGYGLVRVIGGWPDLLSDRKYGVLHTEAGSVHLLNYATDSRVYEYVTAHTSPDDYVLDLPYGGGLNFASGRRYPIFNVQLYGLAVPQKYQDLDMQMFQRNPPRLIVSQDEPYYGTFFGYGMKGYRACPCPRLVWVPDRLSWDPNYVFPLVTYIGDHYQAVAKFGDKVILERK